MTALSALVSDITETTIPLLYVKLLVVGFAPVIIVAASTLCWSVCGLARRKFHVFVLKHNAATILVALFFIHPILVKLDLQAFSCMQLDGTDYLEAALEQQCWVHTHLQYALTIALPSIVVWGVGIPALAVVLLRRKYRSRTLDTLPVREVYGFLYESYRPQAYYWEVVVLYRKMVIIFDTVFLSLVSPTIQAITALVICEVAFHLHRSTGPFMTARLNRLEELSIVCSTITMICGLYYLSGDLGSKMSTVVFVVLIGVNALFVLTWAKAVLGVLVTTAKEQPNSIFRKLFSFCLSRTVIRPKVCNDFEGIDGEISRDVETKKGEFLWQIYNQEAKEGDKWREAEVAEMVRNPGLMYSRLDELADIAARDTADQ